MIRAEQVAEDVKKDFIEDLVIPLPNGEWFEGPAVEVATWTNSLRGDDENLLAEATIYVTRGGQVIITAWVIPIADNNGIYERTWITPSLQDALIWSARIAGGMLTLSQPMAPARYPEFYFADALLRVWDEALPVLRTRSYAEHPANILIGESALYQVGRHLAAIACLDEVE